MDNCTTKVCSKCHEIKPLAEFSEDKRRKDRVGCRCKACKRDYQRAYYEQHREEYRAYCRVCGREHTEERRAYHRAYQRVYREQHQEESRAQARAYHQEHREKYRAHTQRRRARKAALPPEHNTLTAQDWREVLDASKHRCWYCGKKETKARKLTLDHRLALNKGGAHTKENVVPACKSCNSRKHTKDELTFLMERNQN